jgi:hypothetical protein
MYVFADLKVVKWNLAMAVNCNFFTNRNSVAVFYWFAVKTI